MFACLTGKVRESCVVWKVATLLFITVSVAPVSPTKLMIQVIHRTGKQMTCMMYHLYHQLYLYKVFLVIQVISNAKSSIYAQCLIMCAL